MQIQVQVLMVIMPTRLTDGPEERVFEVQDVARSEAGLHDGGGDVDVVAVSKERETRQAFARTK